VGPVENPAAREESPALSPEQVSALRRTLLRDAIIEDPVLLQRVVSAAERAVPGRKLGPRAEATEGPSYAWPVFLGLAGSVVASRKASRSGHRVWPYWLVGAASTALVGWALLTVMPAAMGRGEHARSIYGTIPRDDAPDGYVPQGVPGVTDVPGTSPEHHHGPATAVDLEPPSYESSV